MPSKERIAVVGGGVSGLAAAWHLQQKGIEVHLFEAEASLGGHACTLPVEDTEVDIGFMVFNHANYPNMVPWFRAMGVEEEDSDMSLSVSLDRGSSMEWSSDGLKGLLGPYPLRQLCKPAFYRFLWDMLRFNSEGAELLTLAEDDPRRHVTTEEYLRNNGYSEDFAQFYLLPMMAALWSASLPQVMEFPAAQLMGFLCHHQMLQLFQRPQWKTVKGRSKQYTKKVEELLRPNVHLSTPIEQVVRKNKAYTIVSKAGKQFGTYDQVVFACHPPTAYQMLQNVASDDLKQLLAQIHYEPNDIYVHSDPSLMPKQSWASWNCLGKLSDLPRLYGKSNEGMEGSSSGFGNTADSVVVQKAAKKAVFVTYYLNRLQNLQTSTDIFVTLNPLHKPDRIHHHMTTWSHPQFGTGTLAAREQLRNRSFDGLWFCGAWLGYGFHEDGCRSGLEVATSISKEPVAWASEGAMVASPPNLTTQSTRKSWFGLLKHWITYKLPVAICKPWIMYFLKQAIRYGTLRLKMNDGSVVSFGDGSPCGRGDQQPVTLRIFDDWFFVKTALEYDLGLARSYMAGYFTVEPLEDNSSYHPVMCPEGSVGEANVTLGDPIGLTRMFLLFIGNRDVPPYTPRKAGKNSYANAMTNASGLFIAKLGSFFNYLRYKMAMNNSERGGSLRNIHAHYDLSNDLFRTFLDKETLMYSSAIYDAVQAPSPVDGLVFRGSLEEAQWRKLDTLLHRAQVKPGQTLLDIGFGWGGLSLHAAKKYGCSVTGITLSVEQKALAEERVREQGLESLITFEVVDYRTFARREENRGKFDRVLSCEMIEAVGHEHLGEFYWAVEQVLAHDGVLVMEAITTPEQRYETYIRSTDFINTIIFPGSCCPSLHALVDAAYKNSCLTLEHIDNIGLHYAETLAEWRRRFNQRKEFVRSLGFDDVFMRCWNYYLTYCEAGFFSQTENCLILVFTRQGCSSLIPLCETKSVTQHSQERIPSLKSWTEISA